MSEIYIQYLYRCLYPYRKRRIYYKNTEYIPSPLSKCMNRDDLIKLRQEELEELEKEEINKKLVLEELSQSLKSEDLFFIDQLCDYNDQDSDQDSDEDCDIKEILNDSDNKYEDLDENNDNLDKDLEDMIFDIIDL